MQNTRMQNIIGGKKKNLFIQKCAEENASLNFKLQSLMDLKDP